MLTLYELIYLLTLDDEKGNLIWFARKSFVYPAVGVILAELALSGRLVVGEKLRLVVPEGESTGDPIFDAVLEQIRSSEKAHKPSYWVSHLSEEPKKLRQSIGERLVEKNVLISDEKRFFRQDLVAGTESVSPEKFQLKHELRASILSNAEQSLRNITMLKMLDAGDLLCLLFTQDEIETAKRIIHKQLLTTALGNPILQLVEEIAQAVESVLEDEME